MTEAETIGIIAGHQRLQSFDSEKFRNIYGLLAGYFGVKGNIKSLWPIPTDYGNQITPEELEERNRNAMIIAEKLGIFKAEC